MARKKETEQSTPHDLLSELEEKFGKGSIIKASNEKFIDVKEVTPTGSLTLDLATKIGGVPKGGLLTHILGKESSSKTTLSLHIIAEEQKKGNPCAFLDVEGTFDPKYAENIGVDLDNLYLVHKDMLIQFLKKQAKHSFENRADIISGEEWLDVLVGLLQTKKFGIIVLDSVATLTPLSELVAGIAAGGQLARVGAMLSKAMRTINANLIQTNTGLIFLNQYRLNPGVQRGNPYVEVGGEALKYYTALKIELSKSLDKEGEGDATEVFGIEVKAKVTKSKVGIPYGRGKYYVEFGRGILRVSEVFGIAVEAGIIKRTGGWYELPDIESKIQGEDNALQFLQDNSEYMKTIEQKIEPIVKGESIIEQVNTEE